MKIKLMYGPGSGAVVDVHEGADIYSWPLPLRGLVFTEEDSNLPPKEPLEIPTVEYSPRPLSKKIWYPKDLEDWYVGEQWDGFRPDGAPSPGDRK